MCRKERYIAFWRLTEKYVFLYFFISAFFLAACGDSDSGVGANEQQAEEEYDDSSSSKSVKSSSSTKSGSIAKSSSSKKSSSSTKNSSSSKTSSSSVSSSSEKSSSEGSEISSSSSFEQNLSSDTETDEDSLYKSLTCYRGLDISDAYLTKCEKSFFESCLPQRDVYVSEETGEKFMCYKTGWIPYMDSLEIGCGKEENGIVKYMGGSLSGIYGCRNGDWSLLDFNDKVYGFCWDGRLADTIVTTGDYRYVCDGTKWKMLSANEYLGKNCSDLEVIELYGQKEYKCRKSRWTELTSLDSLYGLCLEDSLGVMKVKDDFYHYICKDYEWTKATTEEVLGECTEDRNFEMLEVYSYYYICDSGAWRSPSVLESIFGVCKPERSKEWDTYQNVYYECIGPEWKWTEITPDRIVGECIEEWQGMTFGKPYSYICDKETWRKFTDVEKKLKMPCIEENEGIKKSYTLNSDTKTEYYQCKDGMWTKITEEKYLEE